MQIEVLQTLSNKNLLERLSTLRGEERETLYLILVHLAEVDRRKLYLECAHSSLFSYCTAELGYSEAAAQRRIVAARCIAKHPEIAEKIRSGELSLSNVSAAASILNENNKEEIIESLSGISRRQAEEVLLKHRPARKRVPDRIKPIRVQPAVPPSVRSSEPSLFDDNQLSQEVECYQLSFSVSAKCMEKIEALKALVSNKASTRTLDGLLEHIVDDYLERHSPEAKQKRRQKRREKRKAAKKATKKTMAALKDKRTRAISAATRDAVFVRDRGRCSFVSSDGTRCCSRHALQIDHVEAFAKGGDHSPENLRLLCAAHNQHAADKEFGRQWMEACRSNSSRVSNSTFAGGGALK